MNILLTLCAVFLATLSLILFAQKQFKDMIDEDRGFTVEKEKRHGWVIPAVYFLFIALMIVYAFWRK